MGLILNNPGLLFSGAYNQYYMLNPTLAQIQARYPTNFGARNALSPPPGSPDRIWPRPSTRRASISPISSMTCAATISARR